MSRESFGHRLLQSVLLSLLTLIIVVAVIVAAVYLALNKKADIEDHSWLVLDLYGEVTEYAPPGDIFSQVTGGEGLVLQDLLDALHKAARDDRIAGVIWKLSSSHDAGPAKLEELRAATQAVRAAGKPVYAWGDTYDLRTLFLAAACDSVYLPAGGYLELRGLSSESMHLLGTLEKLGVAPHFSKIREYKAATEMFTEKQMTPPARENRTWMLREYWEGMVPALARGLGVPESYIPELMEFALFTPDQARDAGLIDGVLYWQDLESRLLVDDEDALRAVDLDTYGEVSWQDLGHKGRERVVVVHAQGMIGGRENRVDPALGLMMGHETIVAALRRARLDDEVKAVVLRVDSGGGESLASDLIAHEVDLVAQRKPIVASMVDVAASGGYMISYKATRIVADPLTVTGSIGSINGFFNARGLYDKLGITKDHVSLGPMARLGDDYHEPTPEEWARFVDDHERGFDLWLRDVARRRAIPYATAQTLAYGRVWSGRQAVANGLIDTTGTLEDALALAAELAAIPAGTTLEVVHLPQRQSLLASVLKNDDGTGPVAAAVRWQLYRALRQQVRESGAALRAAQNVADY